MRGLRFSLHLVAAALLVAVPLSLAAADGPAAAKPIGSPGDWFGEDDYPPAAIRANESGRVVFRIDIDAAGRVARCTITQSSGSAALDQQTCSLIKERATFTPASDRHGRAIAEVYQSAVRWTLPESETTASMIGCAMGMPGDTHVITSAGCI